MIAIRKPQGRARHGRLPTRGASLGMAMCATWFFLLVPSASPGRQAPAATQKQAAPGPSGPSSQARPVNGLVRITGERDGVSRIGSGFVVAQSGDRVVVITAAHVVQGMSPFDVEFAVDSSRQFSVTQLIGQETETRHGLAAFRVTGVPSGVAPLTIDTTATPTAGQPLTLLGYPQGAVSALTLSRPFSGRQGVIYVLDQGVAPGISGGPVIMNGRVTALVSRTDEQFTYAVPARVVREFLEGYNVQLPTPAAPTVPINDPAPTPVEKPRVAVMGPLEYNKAYLQADMYPRATITPSAEACSAMCLNTEQCLAMTFIKSTGECWIKGAVPASASHGDMISAVKQFR